MHLQKALFAPLAISLLSGVLTACSLKPYTLVLNDNVVYTPNESLRNAVTQDPGLQACLDQALERSSQTDPATVTLLACVGAGVQTLAGIEALVNLEQLELGDNAITNLSPLIPLKNLRVLGLRNNRVGDTRPLDELPILRFLSLEGNERVPCRQLDTLQRRLGNTFGRPQSCIN
jgi:Leucine-rich repeat (LRR) protein